MFALACAAEATGWLVPSTTRLLRDLAGNAFTSTILLALEMPIVINIDPRATTENPAPMDTMQSMILNVGLLDD